jgi:hypothetical protein
MKLTPAASARSSRAWLVASSLPILCMNDDASASPNVIPPKQRLDTLTPVDPRLRYSMGGSVPPLSMS